MSHRARYGHQHHQGWNGNGGYGGFDNRRWSDWHGGESAWSSWGGAWGGSWDGGAGAEPGWGGGDWAGGDHCGFSSQDWSGYAAEAAYSGYQEMDPALAMASVEVPTPDTGATGMSSLAPPAGGSRFGSQVDRHYQQDGYGEWEAERRFPHSGPRFVKRPMMVPPGAEEDSADLRGGASALQRPSSSSNAPATTEDVWSSKGESSAPPRRRKPHDRQPGRLWCHIFLHKGHPEFDLVPMLIGKGGCNMRDIYQKTHCKIRVRGRGSGHLEVEGKKEAPVPLMVAVTANVTDSDGFKLAIQMTLARLKTVDDNFTMFCQGRGIQAPNHRLFSIGELSKGAENVLGDALRDSGRMLPLHCADEGYSGAGYESLAACLCSSPWASFRVKNAVLVAAHATPARVPLNPDVHEFAAGTSGSEEDEEVELPELISSQVSAFLQADASDYAKLDS